ncbi:MAG: flagellar protein FlgN [Lachnospiraceae bacterium]|nr:flagellar protein FlgN [Lachnospiraceae bacterium]
MEDKNNYVRILVDALSKKKVALEHIKELTERQALLLKEQRVDFEQFDVLIDEKKIYLEEIAKLDDGFVVTFEKIREHLAGNKELLSTEINSMQNFIREITSLAVEIETMEQRNKQSFELAMSRERQVIKMRRQSKQSASKYYQNVMQAISEESFYMDKKK